MTQTKAFDRASDSLQSLLPTTRNQNTEAALKVPDAASSKTLFFLHAMKACSCELGSKATGWAGKIYFHMLADRLTNLDFESNVHPAVSWDVSPSFLWSSKLLVTATWVTSISFPSSFYFIFPLFTSNCKKVRRSHTWQTLYWIRSIYGTKNCSVSQR